MTALEKTKLNEDYAIKRRVTIVCAALNLLLSVVKIILGVLGQSQALVADGIHSLSDLASDALVLVAAKFGSQDADTEHPYGHARFETAAAIVLGVILIIVATGIAADAIERILEPEHLLHPGPLALVGAIISIALNEWMYWYNIRVANQLKSILMRANAWHHRSDAISSIIVLVSVAGVMLGLPYLDALGAIAVALMIGKIGWDIGWGGMRELVDTGVDAPVLEAIKAGIESVGGVKAFHKLRTRRMGEKILVEAHILVGNDVTVSEGHMISDQVRARLLTEHDDISEVLIHIDPEDDETNRPSSNLPGRDTILQELNECWKSLDVTQRIERINLHYLDGIINVEVLLPLDVASNIEEARLVAGELKRLAEAHPHVGETEVFYR